MPQYPAGFTPEEYDELKNVVLGLGRRGTFDANDLLVAYDEQRRRGLVNAGSVAQILDDLEDLGVIREIEPSASNRPAKYELV